MILLHQRARGYVDPFIAFVALMPFYLGIVTIDVFHALRAEEADEYDYAAEVRRLAIEQYQGDEKLIAEAVAVWHELDRAAKRHGEILEQYHDPELDEGWYDTHYHHYALSSYEELRDEVNELYEEYGEERLNTEMHRLNRQREWAKDVIQKIWDVGVIDSLEKVALAQWSMKPLSGPDSEIHVEASGSSHRALYRCLDVAKRHARQNGEWASYVEYHRLSLALARHWMQQPDSLAWVQGAAMYSGTLSDVCERLARGEIPAWVIRELHRVGQQQAVPDSIGHVLDEQQAETLECIDAYYSAGGVAYIEDAGHLLNLTAILLPRRATAERVVMRFYDNIDEYMTKTPAQRLELGPPSEWAYMRPNTIVGLAVQLPIVLVIQTARVADSIIQLHEMLEMERSAFQMLAAIELYKAEHGELPAQLAELVHEYLDEVPQDPFDPEGGPLRYRLLDAPDKLGRSYILYSVGRDMTDNGGYLKEGGWPKQALREGHPGTDYVMNYID